MIPLLLATTNQGKVAEVTALLADLPVEVLTLASWADLPAPEETGATFAENARIKAEYYARATGRLTVAEDSGLVVDALDGAPGVQSARFGGPGRSDRDRCRLVLEARDLGYTEPDPRDDLSGLDVARKLVILARERGLRGTLQDVRLESLVPDALRDVPLEAFLARVGELDEPMHRRFVQAQGRGKVLRYVASVREDGSTSVGLVELDASHAFAHIQLTDNVVQFTTSRYSRNPLVVQGPGAGPEVTAAGVFADVLRVAAGLGAHQ